MTELLTLTASNLMLPGVRHAFFTRQGGVSEGVYHSLNGGVGSKDDSARVHENRARMARHLGTAPERLLVPFQTHSAEAREVIEPWSPEERPRCDGLVTAAQKLALGVTGADCGMLLFADARAGVIGACHAGWKGALAGMIEATIARMEALGAQRRDIHAALGPAIGARSYEVGPEFLDQFQSVDRAYLKFFSPSAREGRSMFDLPGFIAARVEGVGVASFENLEIDTYADESRCFSFRRSVHRAEPDYGRLVSAISLV
jgi:hypothetical protein